MITQWLLDRGITQSDLTELIGLLTCESNTNGQSESAISSLVRLEAADKGVWLTRNNVGVLTNNRGVPVRYGLSNESSRLNKIFKSSDLIGIRSIVVTPDMVGTTIGQFVARETKKSNWSYRPNDKHSKAQLDFLLFVAMMGGDAAFTNDRGSL